MLSIFTGAIAGIVLGLIIGVCSEKRSTGTVAGISGIIGLAGMLVGVFVAMFLSNFYIEQHKQETWALAAVVRSDAPAGTFVLGSGTIGVDVRYFCLLKTGEGSYRPFVADKGNAISLHEDADLHNEGKLIIHWKEWKPSPALEAWSLIDDGPVDYSYEFHVPVGTVVHKFIVN